MENNIKSLSRMEGWADKHWQNNHKIICAYFICLEKDGLATIESMRRLCGDSGNPALYVKRFSENYASMKTEAGNSHGKVFEDDGNRVWIWDVVAPKCLQLRERFLQGKSW